MTQPPDDRSDPADPAEPLPEHPTAPVGWPTPGAASTPAGPPPAPAPPPPGAAPGPAPGPAQGPVTNRKAVWAITTAVVAVVLSCCCLGFVGIASIVLGASARSEIARSAGRETGDGLALAGIVVGAVAVMLSIASAVYTVGPLLGILFSG